MSKSISHNQPFVIRKQQTRKSNSMDIQIIKYININWIQQYIKDIDKRKLSNKFISFISSAQKYIEQNVFVLSVLYIDRFAKFYNNDFEYLILTCFVMADIFLKDSAQIHLLFKYLDFDMEKIDEMMKQILVKYSNLLYIQKDAFNQCIQTISVSQIDQ